MLAKKSVKKGLSVLLVCIMLAAIIFSSGGVGQVLKAESMESQESIEVIESTEETRSLSDEPVTTETIITKTEDIKVEEVSVSNMGVLSLSQPDMIDLTTFQLGSVIDGTPVWDGDNKPGNDQNAENRVIRTFDNVTYMFDYGVNVKNDVTDDDGHAITTIDHLSINFEAFLPGVTMKEATFDVAVMNWLENAVVEEVNGGG